MKYVMFTHEKTGLRVPVFFPSYVIHEDVKAGIGWIATSAGEYDSTRGRTYGRSMSLGMDPEEDDAEICAACMFSEALFMLTQDSEKALKKLAEIKKRHGNTKRS